MKKRNDNGYSLVEMIIVIAIIAVVTVGASVVLINWQKQNINDCVKKIDSALSAAKVDATGKKDKASVLTISKHDDGRYYLSLTGSEDKALGDKKIKISYTYRTEGSSSTQTVDITEDAETFLDISYERATGSFAPIGEDADGNKQYCTSITVKRDSKEVVFRLSQGTGKHSIER